MHFLLDIAYWPTVISETWEHGPWFYFLIIKCFDEFDAYVKNMPA